MHVTYVLLATIKAVNKLLITKFQLIKKKFNAKSNLAQSFTKEARTENVKSYNVNIGQLKKEFIKQHGWL